MDVFLNNVILLFIKLSTSLNKFLIRSECRKYLLLSSPRNSTSKLRRAYFHDDLFAEFSYLHFAVLVST